MRTCYKWRKHIVKGAFIHSWWHVTYLENACIYTVKGACQDGMLYIQKIYIVKSSFLQPEGHVTCPENACIHTVKVAFIHFWEHAPYPESSCIYTVKGVFVQSWRHNYPSRKCMQLKRCIYTVMRVCMWLSRKCILAYRACYISRKCMHISS